MTSIFLVGVVRFEWNFAIMADVWGNSMACHPRATCHIAGCCHRANSTACHPKVTYHIAGCYHLVNSRSWLQSHMPHCRVQSPGEINVMIVPHCSVRHIENPFRHILFFNAVWALTSASFRIVSDTLVKLPLATARAASLHATGVSICLFVCLSVRL